MSGSKIKILRAFRAGLAIYFAAILILDTADWIDLGHVVLWQLAALAFVASVIGFQTFVIRHQRWIDAIASRPRPDYPAIAAMERDIYGETFGHDGAPAIAGQDEHWPAITHQRRECRQCDKMQQQAGRAQPRRWDGRTTHPDTTEAATLDQYVTWLRGYVKRGGKPTHFYDYPFSRGDFRYASGTVTVDSDYEYGSSSRGIIVAAGVRTERTNPAGPFGGWAHTRMFFMHGYRTNDSLVPVYSDPEFGEFRQYCDRDEHRSNLRARR